MSLQEERNLYGKAFTSVLFQRNIIYLIFFVSLLSILINLHRVYNVSTDKELKPFVIQIDDRSGTTRVLHEVPTKKYAADPNVQHYFLKKYMLARSQFDTISYHHDYYTIVKVLSSGLAYNRFYQFIRSHREPTPPKNMLYRKGNIIHINGNTKVRADITKIDIKEHPEKANTYNAEIHFTQSTINDFGVVRKSYNKIANIEFDFFNDKLEDQDLNYNPLRFRVQKYSDVLKNI